MAKTKCEHRWLYPHRAIEGRSPDTVAVVRICYNCRERQVAFTGPWRKATGDYARDEHYSDCEKFFEPQTPEGRGAR